MAACDSGSLAYWLGAPIVALIGWEAAHALGAIRRGRARRRSWLGMGVPILLLLLALTAHTLGEVARLWVFMVPALTLVAAPRLLALTRGRGGVVFWLVALTQLGWLAALKAGQDFSW